MLPIQKHANILVGFPPGDIQETLVSGSHCHRSKIGDII